MHPVSPAPRRRYLKPALTIALSVLYGCSDAPSPVEPRTVPTEPNALVATVVTVTNTDDAGPGSLRQALIDAPAGAVIQFDAGIAGKTIALSSGKLDIEKAVTIEGPPAGMTISGSLADRVLWIYEDVDAVLRNVAIVDGRSSFGAGVMNHGRLTLDHSLLANNESSESGGGIYLPPNLGAQLVLVNSTVSGNLARRAGGGVASYGSVVMRNSTIAGNTGEGGGGYLGGEGVLTLRNSIIANNVDGDATNGITANCELRPGASVIYAGGNLSNDDGCGSAPAVQVAVPSLGPLANNGGPTKTHALGYGPGVDAGTACTEGTDQRYVLRNQGLSCDLGAFEFTDYGTITLTIHPNAAVNAKTGVATVTGTIRCSASGSMVLDVGMSQTQKTTGKFSTIVQAQGALNVPACGTSPSSWSAVLTPGTGKFQTGSATGVASTASVVGGFIPTSATATLKVFNSK